MRLSLHFTDRGSYSNRQKNVCRWYMIVFWKEREYTFEISPSFIEIAENLIDGSVGGFTGIIWYQFRQFCELR